MTEDSFIERVVRYYEYSEEDSIKRIAKTSVKIMLNEHFDEICSFTFQEPGFEEMQEWVLDEMKRCFDEKAIEAIDHIYPNLSEDEFQEKLAELEKYYEKEQEEQLEKATISAMKELKVRTRKMQKEIKEIKEKYTA